MGSSSSTDTQDIRRVQKLLVFFGCGLASLDLPCGVKQNQAGQRVLVHAGAGLLDEASQLVSPMV